MPYTIYAGATEMLTRPIKWLPGQFLAFFVCQSEAHRARGEAMVLAIAPDSSSCSLTKSRCSSHCFILMTPYRPSGKLPLAWDGIENFWSSSNLTNMKLDCLDC